MPNGHPVAHSGTRHHARLTDAATARQAFDRIYHLKEISVRGSMDWTVSTARLGPITVVRGKVLGTCDVLAVPASTHIISLAHRGGIRGHAGRLDGDIVAGRSGMLFSPDMSMCLHTRPELGPFESLTTQIDRDFLAAQLEALADTSLDAPLVFGPRIVLDQPAVASVERLLRYLHAESELDSTLLDAPLLAASVCELLARLILTGLPHSHSHLLEARPAAAGVSAVDMAAEYMATHATEPLTIADVARVAGTSVRALERAFRQQRGVTPTAFLRATRLALVHRRLLVATAGTRVVDIAHACGFLHMGRFGVEYRARYGERPSDTLRRGLRIQGDAGLHRLVGPDETP